MRSVSKCHTSLATLNNQCRRVQITEFIHLLRTSKNLNFVLKFVYYSPIKNPRYIPQCKQYISTCHTMDKAFCTSLRHLRSTHQNAVIFHAVAGHLHTKGRTRSCPSCLEPFETSPLRRCADKISSDLVYLVVKYKCTMSIA